MSSTLKIGENNEGDQSQNNQLKTQIQVGKFNKDNIKQSLQNGLLERFKNKSAENQFRLDRL